MADPNTPTNLAVTTPTSDTTPGFTCDVTDPDLGDKIKARFEIETSGGVSIGSVDSAFEAGLSPTRTAEYTSALSIGNYRVRAKAIDEAGGQSGYTSYVDFFIGTITTKDLAILFDVKVITNKDLALLYDIKEITNKDLEILFDVLDKIVTNKDLEILFDIAGITEKDLALLWDVKEEALKDLVLLWDSDIPWTEVTTADIVWTEVVPP